MSQSHHQEKHYIERLGWLRASVLGANDGIISVTSLVTGMAATGVTTHVLLITCLAGWISGAISMAAGEYVSVKSQEDIEESDLALERRELHKNPEMELKELTNIYIHRGLDATLAHQVAVKLTEHNALEAHARDEIGINAHTAAKPVQAAFSSAISFSLGASLPTLSILLIPDQWLSLGIIVVGVMALAVLGAISSYLAGTSLMKGALRISLWGILAMIVTSWIGSLFDVTI
ncbi:VIT family protein [Acinetobacter puyangensis]|uniref:Predicted Fe2+/Mn2+ transporter, VIT1/CCC1 family n=1 Tax=Acinetobacter puyangensis TaxID=1096779 RepID=A0A240E6F0_9GAMM|nr:VIT family protein [Acinetobacter puyangensis]SNX44338.1 Predicted Fe2+/Mn2+ transporter, VIT1/CCC1 family [Acinetobacter puyangensis]